MGILGVGCSAGATLIASQRCLYSTSIEVQQFSAVGHLKKTLSKDLEITAETKDGLIMGVKHKKYNVHGVQFHPESIKTKLGIKILKNFIRFKNK